ncbi:hypothetical protein [Lederbergia citri]|uniref:Uncharacterized protein n=1 Tax=Lederbergia citri TaxID=2833580 RepID=A0A942YIC2_9BACI|nr:hypothetical protein [Lederbergia citri]MBS4196310.1 hypothetical protein [Lederbergia citri]
MKIKMTKKMFSSIDNIELGKACFAPIIPMIRGKSIEIKKQIYNQLSPEQKDLFMFSVYYNHAEKSLYEFYWWSAYYYAQPDAWIELKRALIHFKAKSMLCILNELEDFFREKNYSRNLENINLSQKDIDNQVDLQNFIQSMFTKFKEISPITLNKIGDCIRENPYQFVYLEDV